MAQPPLPLPVRPSAKSKQPYPFYLGGIATSMAATFTHPLDLTRVRLQTIDPKPTMLRAMVDCVKAEGVRGLFDGLSGSWFRGMTYSLTRFWVFDKAKLFFTTHYGSGVGTSIASGAVAGICGGFVANPGDVILTRMQADKGLPPAQRFGYRHIFDGFRRIPLEEGPSKLMRGLNVTIFRAILTNCGQLASYDIAKDQLLKRNVFNDNPYCHFAASFIAGTVGTTLMMPADVVRSRIMASGSAKSSAVQAIRDLYRQGAIAPFFRGFLPNWSRQTPQTILTFLFLEQLRNLVDWSRAKPITAEPL